MVINTVVSESQYILIKTLSSDFSAAPHKEIRTFLVVFGLILRRFALVDSDSPSGVASCFDSFIFGVYFRLRKRKLANGCRKRFQSGVTLILQFYLHHRRFQIKAIAVNFDGILVGGVRSDVGEKARACSY